MWNRGVATGVSSSKLRKTSRNIFGVLTHKNLTLINGSLSNQQKELKVYQKIDYEYATAMAISQTKVYIGDGKGTIDLV